MTMYYATIVDPITGVTLIEDLECDVSGTLDVSAGDLDYTIDSIEVDDKRLLHGGPISKALHNAVADLIEDDIANDGKFRAAIIEENNVSYRGRGGLDPDGRWV